MEQIKEIMSSPPPQWVHDLAERAKKQDRLARLKGFPSSREMCEMKHAAMMRQANKERGQ